MAPHKDFDFAPFDGDVDPITFTVLGESFKAEGQITDREFNEIMKAYGSDDIEDAARVIGGFVERHLVDDSERSRWLEVSGRLDRPRGVQIMTWLIEQYGGERPTEPPSPSGDGRQTAGDISMAEQSETELTEAV